jgi:cell division protein FtsB
MEENTEVSELRAELEQWKITVLALSKKIEDMEKTIEELDREALGMGSPVASPPSPADQG